MPSLKEIKGRIGSVKSTLKIMEMTNSELSSVVLLLMDLKHMEFMLPSCSLAFNGIIACIPRFEAIDLIRYSDPPE